MCVVKERMVHAKGGKKGIKEGEEGNIGVMEGLGVQGRVGGLMMMEKRK